MRSGDFLAPTLLVAMPQLQDPNFSRSVVLLCEHGPDGAMGFVVNRPTDVLAASAVSLEPPVRSESPLMLWAGGPVETHRGFVLVGGEGLDGTEEIGEGLHLTASADVLRQLLEADPDDIARYRCRVLLGYAGWGPGQLDAELAASAWLSAPPDPDLVFASAPETMWDAAIRALGVDPMMLAPGPGIQ